MPCLPRGFWKLQVVLQSWTSGTSSRSSLSFLPFGPGYLTTSLPTTSLWTQGLSPRIPMASTWLNQRTRPYHVRLSQQHWARLLDMLSFPSLVALWSFLLAPFLHLPFTWWGSLGFSWSLHISLYSRAQKLKGLQVPSAEEKWSSWSHCEEHHREQWSGLWQTEHIYALSNGGSHYGSSRQLLSCRNVVSVVRWFHFSKEARIQTLV